MSQKVKTSLLLAVTLSLWAVSTALAQDPRPTPTNMPPPTPTTQPTNTPISSPTNTPVPNPTNTPVPNPTNTPVPNPPPANDSGNQNNGFISGAVYQDVNGDGQCIGTGVAGENPLADVVVAFVTEDEQTIITLKSAGDGNFGLAAAGFSNWNVSAKPDAGWVVTSAKTLKVPVSAESPVVTNVNFCLAKSSAVSVILPEAGASRNASQLLLWALALGGSLFFLGLGWRWRETR